MQSRNVKKEGIIRTGQQTARLQGQEIISRPKAIFIFRNSGVKAALQHSTYKIRLIFLGFGYIYLNALEFWLKREKETEVHTNLNPKTI